MQTIFAVQGRTNVASAWTRKSDGCAGTHECRERMDAQEGHQHRGQDGRRSTTTAVVDVPDVDDLRTARTACARSSHPHFESPQLRQVMQPSILIAAFMEHFAQSCASAGNAPASWADTFAGAWRACRSARLPL